VVKEVFEHDDLRAAKGHDLRVNDLILTGVLAWAMPVIAVAAIAVAIMSSLSFLIHPSQQRFGKGAVSRSQLSPEFDWGFPAWRDPQPRSAFAITGSRYAGTH
jgi:hypothetical protein